MKSGGRLSFVRLILYLKLTFVGILYWSYTKILRQQRLAAEFGCCLKNSFEAACIVDSGLFYINIYIPH